MTLQIRHDDPCLAWEGVVSLQRTVEWTMPWRIPYDQCGLFHDILVARAAMPSGVRLAFRSDTTAIAGSIIPVPESTQIDLVCNGTVFGSFPLSGADSFRFEGLPVGAKLIELWLPQFGEFRLKYLELEDGSEISPAEDLRSRWITYGSSITQCRTAESPSQTWPAIVARARGLNLTSLGFGGQCHLDPMVARVMRDLPADLISMCVGINIYGGAGLGPRTFRSGIIAFVQIVREKHPDTPLIVMSPIYSWERETTPNAVGFTLSDMREEVAAAADALRAYGDRNIHYVNGLDVLGPAHGHLLPDKLHPNAEGYRLMGRNFLDKVIAQIFPKRA